MLVCRTENGVDARPGNLDFQTVADVVDVGQSGSLRRVGFPPRTSKTTLAMVHGREEQWLSLHLTFEKVYDPWIRFDAVQS